MLVSNILQGGADNTQPQQQETNTLNVKSKSFIFFFNIYQSGMIYLD